MRTAPTARLGIDSGPGETDCAFPSAATADEASSRLIAPLVASGLFLILGAVVPLLLCRATPRPLVGIWWAALVVAEASALRMSYLVGSARRRLYEFNFWLYFYAFLGLAPLVQLREGSSPSTTPGMTWSNAAATVGITVVAGAAFLLGGWLARAIRRGRDELVRAPLPLRPRRVHLLAATALIIDAYYVSKIGISSLLGSRDALEQAATAAWPDPTTRVIVRSLATMLLLVASIALLQLRRESAGSGRSSGASWLPAGLVGLVLVATVNPVSSARYVAGTVLLALAAACGAYGTRRRFRWVAVASVVGLLFVFPLADSFRHSTNVDIKQQSLVSSLTSGDFDSFAQIANAQMFVTSRGSTDGRQGLGAALFWVPRAAWRDKPQDTGTLLAQSRGYSFTNLSAPLPAELYVNGSWLILLAGMVGTGWLVRRSDDRILRVLQSQKMPGVLGCILPGYLVIVLRGSLLQAMAGFFVIVISGHWVARGQTLSHEPGRAIGTRGTWLSRKLR